MMSSRLSVLLLGVVIALAGCSGEEASKDAASNSRHGRKGMQRGGPRGGYPGGGPGEKKDRPQLRVPVVVTAATLGDMEAFLDASSILEAEDAIEVVSQATGVVVEVGAEEGDRVKKGHLLARLDYEELELAEERAHSQFQRLEQEHERAAGLAQEKLLSEEDFQKVGFDLRQAEIDWRQKKLELERTRISAPISGTLSERLVRVGELKRANDPVFRMVDFNSLVAPVFVPEKYLAQLSPGQRVILSAPALQQRQVEGRVTRVSPVVDSQSGTVRVVITPGSLGDLRPGMFVTVQLELDKHEGVVILPKKALVYDDERPHLFVVDEGVAHRRAVRLGYQDDEHAEILEGIEKGEMVVIVGQSGLKDASPVAAEDEQGNPLEVTSGQANETSGQADGSSGQGDGTMEQADRSPEQTGGPPAKRGRGRRP